jgi:hypothetical protein
MLQVTGLYRCTEVKEEKERQACLARMPMAKRGHRWHRAHTQPGHGLVRTSVVPAMPALK